MQKQQCQVNEVNEVQQKSPTKKVQQKSPSKKSILEIEVMKIDMIERKSNEEVHWKVQRRSQLKMFVKSP